VNKVYVCVTLLVKIISGLGVSGEEASCLIPKCSVLFCVFITMRKLLVNATDIPRVQTLSKISMLQLGLWFIILLETFCAHFYDDL
jgi:hypothetical protein